ncbi:MAG: helix-turn-helix domain-containing protein [Nakamurella sp.]
MTQAILNRTRVTTGHGRLSAGYDSLHRGLQIVGLVQDRGRITVAEIAESMSIPLSTVYRYIGTLRETDFLVDDEGFIAPGPRMAEQSTEKTHLVDVAKPILQQLRDATDLTVLLLVRVHTMALCIDWAPAARRHRIFFGRGQIRPIAAGGSALPLLAFAPPNIIQTVSNQISRGPTAASPTSIELATLLPQIRADGVSISRGHITPGLTSIGVPVLVAGRCLCSISMVGEDGELPSGEMTDLRIRQIKSVAEQIVAALPDSIAREEWSNADI